MKLDIFLIDIDGVACAHAKAVCKWVYENYKIDSKVEDVTTWDHNFGPISFIDAVKKCYSNEEFILNMEVTDGFHEFVEKITRIKRVKFASTRETSHDATCLWVKRNFGEDFEVVFVKRKIEINFDYLIDDYPDEVISAAKKGKTSFLLSQPWNNNENTKTLLKNLKHAYFVENFSQILNFFNRNL